MDICRVCFNFLSFSWKAWQHTNASHDDSDNCDDSNDEESKASSDGSDLNSEVSSLMQNRRRFGNRNIQHSTSEEDEGEGEGYGGYESIFEYNKASLNDEASSIPSRFTAAEVYGADQFKTTTTRRRMMRPYLAVGQLSCPPGVSGKLLLLHTWVAMASIMFRLRIRTKIRQDISYFIERVYTPQ